MFDRVKIRNSRTIQPDVPIDLAEELRGRVGLEVPGCAYPIRKHDGACLECDAKHGRVVFMGDVPDEMYKLGAEHLVNPSGGRTVVVVLERSSFYGAAGFGEQSSGLEDLGIEAADELDCVGVHNHIGLGEERAHVREVRGL